MESYKQTLLSSTVTITQYEKWENNENKIEIAQFVYDRFEERYIRPLKKTPRNSKHGFCIMAICCLMVEALESFWQGWPNTCGKSRMAFEAFFKRKQNAPLSMFINCSDDFYRHIRCGIHHQGEATGGWRIWRTGLVLLDENQKVIDATKFLEALDECLFHYQQALEQAEWDDEIWVNLTAKMKAVCDNCKPLSGETENGE